MKKAFLFLFAATVAAAMSFNSCTNPPVTPDDGDKTPTDSIPVNDSTDTDKPGDEDAEYEGMSEQWINVNKMVKEKWGTTTTIPEPQCEYTLIQATYNGEPNQTWKHGMFNIVFSGIDSQIATGYPEYLKTLGWREIENDNNIWISDSEGKDYLIITKNLGTVETIDIYYRKDVLQDGKW